MVQQHVRRASWVTGTAMIVGIAGVWIGVHYIERLDRWSEDVRTGLALLRWAAVAIGLSSLKRPLVLGLIALHHEREVCTVNVPLGRGRVNLHSVSDLVAEYLGASRSGGGMRNGGHRPARHLFSRRAAQT